MKRPLSASAEWRQPRESLERDAAPTRRFAYDDRGRSAITREQVEQEARQASLLYWQAMNGAAVELAQ